MNKFFKSITLLTILCFTACATGRVPIRAGEVPTQAELSPTEIKYGAAAYNELARLYQLDTCLLYTSPSPRDKRQSRMPSSA